ncbi:hypothetical protein C2869_06530 [Saccharobesus litoralis]|uniref:DinB family protein n=1 Tax=Saccharobesus litoralis TaxID=2172099 RepID=A0A2S0VPH6_9ALTE|nr:DinB family protein [Saccharobesus litoralis]AWB66116.1 hypothetical protein C2869_06530 [Saccharobesus litoralis]
MLLSHAVNVLDQIESCLQVMADLPAEQRKYYAELSLGRHVRHISDHYLAFLSACGGTVFTSEPCIDYNTRHRDSPIETDIHLAREHIRALQRKLASIQISVKTKVTVMSEIDCSDMQTYAFSSSIERELLYLINHTIHHAAYMALLAKQKGIYFPENIGVAPSTLTYQRQLSE